MVMKKNKQIGLFSVTIMFLLGMSLGSCSKDDETSSSEKNLQKVAELVGNSIADIIDKDGKVLFKAFWAADKTTGNAVIVTKDSISAEDSLYLTSNTITTPIQIKANKSQNVEGVFLSDIVPANVSDVADNKWFIIFTAVGFCQLHTFNTYAQGADVALDGLTAATPLSSVDNGPIMDIQPSDIDSKDILKDPALSIHVVHGTSSAAGNGSYYFVVLPFLTGQPVTQVGTDKNELPLNCPLLIVSLDSTGQELILEGIGHAELVQVDGTPGSGARIRIKGVICFKDSNSPLILID